MSRCRWHYSICCMGFVKGGLKGGTTFSKQSRASWGWVWGDSVSKLIQVITIRVILGTVGLRCLLPETLSPLLGRWFFSSHCFPMLTDQWHIMAYSCLSIFVFSRASSFPLASSFAICQLTPLLIANCF